MFVLGVYRRFSRGYPEILETQGLLLAKQFNDDFSHHDDIQDFSTFVFQPVLRL